MPRRFDIVLVGTVDMSRVVKQMLDRVSDRVTAIVHAPETHADLLDEHGCLIPDQWMNCRLDIPIDATRIADDPDEQATLAIHEIAAFHGGRQADEIAIGVANEDLVPPLLQRLSDAGVTGRWPIAMQLCDTRPFRLLNGIVRHLTSARAGQPPDFPTLSDLVRHPDVSRWIDRWLVNNSPGNNTSGNKAGSKTASVDWLTELDRYIATHLQTSPGVLLGFRERREVVGGILKAVEHLLSCLCPDAVPTESAPLSTEGAKAADGKSRASKAKSNSRQQQLTFDDQAEVVSVSLHGQLSSQKSIHVWGDGILKLLATIYDDYELQPDSIRDRGIVACCEKLADTMESLRQIPDSVMPACDAAQALQLLLGQVADLSIPPEADDHTIDLLGWL